MGKRIGTSVEIVIVAGLVDSNSPQNNRRMVPIAANHAAHVVH